MRVVLKGISKVFGKLRAVDDVSLEIGDGDFFTLLGPSGCGKTTLLRVIAGFYPPDGGEVYFGERLVNDVPPHRRETGMVFQNYALFPHLTVRENIAYGLRVRKVGRAEMDARIGEMIRSVRLEGLEKRFPSQLSGGQQQRVALARALVISPQILRQAQAHLELYRDLIVRVAGFSGVFLAQSPQVQEEVISRTTHQQF